MDAWVYFVLGASFGGLVCFAIGWFARSDAARLRPIVERVRQDSRDDIAEALERLRWN